MGKLQNIDLSLSFDWIVLIAGTILLIAYAVFIYKYTIPRISKKAKIFLILIRSVILFLILLMIFEPVITLTYKKQIVPELDIFVDNSVSITAKDSLKRENDIMKAVEDLSSFSGFPVKLHTFSSSVSDTEGDPGKIKFDGTVTNLSAVISYLGKSGNTGAAILISDGIITDGSNPVYAAEKLQFPLFTLGVGDTSTYNDVAIRKTLSNEYIYLNKPSTVEVSITNSGFSGRNVSVTLKDNNQAVANKNIQLSETGNNKISFEYTPQNTGERKLTVSVTPLEGEESRSNNTSIFYVTVLNDKLKIAIVAGSPSPDLAIISSALEEDKNLTVITSAEISGTKQYTDPGQHDPIDSSDVLFLVNFPSKNTSRDIIERVMRSVSSKNKPYFILVSPLTDLNKLKTMEPVLPFSIPKVSNDYTQVQPDGLNPAINSLFSLGGAESEINNLPPVTRSISDFMPKPESAVLLKSRINNIPVNIPLMISKSIGSARSFAFLAGDLWKWKLQTAESKSVFFDRLLNGMVKWLNASSKQKQFTVRVPKKIFSSGEGIEFTAQLYDQSFSPVDTAGVTLNVENGNDKLNIDMSPLGNGLYSASFQPKAKGDFTYSASANINGIDIKTQPEKLSVGEIDIEKQNTQMDVGLLKQISNSTGGFYESCENYEPVKSKLFSILKNASKDKVSLNEFKLWSSEWTLIVILCLFAFEWFLRKRLGML